MIGRRVYLGLWANTVSGIRGSEVPDGVGWVIAKGSLLTLSTTQIRYAIHVPAWMGVVPIVGSPQSLITLE